MVVLLDPPHRSPEVTPGARRRLVVRFDRDMNVGSHSFCGDGPTFPRGSPGAAPVWEDSRTCVLEVDLEPDHVYELSINCRRASGFRSSEGVPAAPVHWRFATLPANPVPREEQERINRSALAALGEILAASYSHLELHGLDWKAQLARWEPSVLAARSPRGLATALGKLLEPTRDLHLSLSAGPGWSVPAGTRLVDPLHRGPLLRRYLASVELRGQGIVVGRTEDGLGYLGIASWSSPGEAELAEKALAELRSTRALLLDVRPNAGGDELLARSLAAWFVEGKKTYARHQLRTGKGPEGFGPVQDRWVEGTSEPERQYRGRVALLSGPHVMSSCESFVLMMKQARDCTVFGKTTQGSSGRPLPHELPGGVTAHVPSWKDLLLDGTPLEGHGVRPDVEVQCAPDDLATRDPILEAALAALRARNREEK